MATVDQILEEWRRGQNSANEANQQRLDQILGLLEGQGQNAIEETRRSSAERVAGGDQSLMDRGLFNTTILDANRRREGEVRDREINRINEGVALNKAGVLERVFDNGPDFGSLLSLLGQLGQGEGANAGGRSFNFAGVNRPGGPIDPFGTGGIGGGAGGAGGGGSGGGGGGGGVQTFTNPGAGHDAFNNQSVSDPANLPGGAGGDTQLRTIPRTVWFQNPAYRVRGDSVYDARTGQLVGRRGN